MVGMENRLESWIREDSDTSLCCRREYLLAAPTESDLVGLHLLLVGADGRSLSRRQDMDGVGLASQLVSAVACPGFVCGPCFPPGASVRQEPRQA